MAVDLTSLTQTSGTSSSSTKSSATASKNLVSMDDFLKILVAQLKNQDPMNPQKPEEFLSQLAQMTTVSQLNNISDSLTSMKAGNTTSQWVSTIGKKVNASSTVLAQGDQIVLSPQASYDKAVLTVKDVSTGSTSTITYQPGDDLTYTNTGSGNLQITSVSASLNGDAVNCDAMVLKVVKGLAIYDTGPVLVLANGETVDASKVQIIKD
jgi:flagellar basal-body rod modification protein FlgD